MSRRITRIETAIDKAFKDLLVDQVWLVYSYTLSIKKLKQLNENTRKK